MKDSRGILKTITCFCLMALALLLSSTASAAEAGKSQCVICHTQIKPLIKLTWEVEKIKPKLKSSETSGEG